MEAKPIPGPIVAVVGPTASGKTDLSLDLAERLGGEVVNTDAMAVYRGMDIGTAKLPVAERRGIPHHLLDILTVRDPLTVAEFQQQARAVARRAARSRRGAGPGRRVGALHAGDPRPVRVPRDRPGGPPAARGRARRGRVRCPAPPAARRSMPRPPTRILPENGRRVVRALEVIEITGRPFSASLPQLEYVDPASVQVGVDIDRPTLDAADRAAGGPDVRGRLRRRGGPAARRGTGRRAHRLGARSATARSRRTSPASSRSTRPASRP